MTAIEYAIGIVATILCIGMLTDLKNPPRTHWGKLMALYALLGTVYFIARICGVQAW